MLYSLHDAVLRVTAAGMVLVQVGLRSVIAFAPGQCTAEDKRV